MLIKRPKILNVLLLMCLVDNYFTKYELSNEPQSRIKNNLLNAFTFCEHYKIFSKLSKKLLEEYNQLGATKRYLRLLNLMTILNINLKILYIYIYIINEKNNKYRRKLIKNMRKTNKCRKN